MSFCLSISFQYHYGVKDYIYFVYCQVILYFFCAEIILDLAREGFSAVGTGLVCVLAFGPVYPLHPAQTCHCCLCEEMEF